MCHLRRLFGISFFDKRPRAATCRNGATMARAKALFADVDLFTVSIRPEPPKTGRAVTAETQTAPIAARDVGTSVAVAVEMGSQTETHSSSQTTSSSGGDEGKEADSGDADKERADAESALAMRRLAPSMLAELSRSADSTALQGYPPPPLASGLSGVSSSGNGGASSHHCTLKPPAGSLAARQRLQCTGVGWNAGGTVVCASFGNLATSGWCLQGGSLCAWPVFRRGFDASSAPEVVLEHSSCLMSLACHPTQPSLVACGSFNGEVLLFDLSVASKSRHRQSAGQAATLSEVGGSEHKEADNSSRDSDPTSRGESDDPLVFASKVDDYFHREPVRCVTWVWDPTAKAHALCSVSADGKALIWHLKHGLKHPSRGTQLSLLAPVNHAAAASSSSSGLAGGRSSKGGYEGGSGRDSSSGVGGGRGGLGRDLGVHGGMCVAFAGVSSANGGTVAPSLQTATMVVGSEAGALLAWPPSPPINVNETLRALNNGSGGDNGSGGSSCVWDPDAATLLAGIGNPSARSAVQAHVEQWAKSRSGYGRLDPSAVFAAKPDPSMLFGSGSSSGVHRLKFEPHAGPVLGVAASPFHRLLFASAGADGGLRLSSVLQPKPLCDFDTTCAAPGKGYSGLGGLSVIGGSCVHQCAWSPTRPLVLACASSNGAVLVYDLGVSTVQPAVQIRAPDSSSSGSGGVSSSGATAVHTLAFNPKMRAFLAYGDASGSVHVCRVPLIADAKVGEERDLGVLVKSLADHNEEDEEDEEEEDREGGDDDMNNEEAKE